ncbi:hypothetical protein GFM44_33080 [Rhizobium leguminosarum bv. viciae]|nr:hypothetical protein [Rhizobium leguminosarum bv. viciae]
MTPGKERGCHKTERRASFQTRGAVKKTFTKRKPPLPIRGDWQRRFLQRRASFQTRKGRCNTLNFCIILSLNRFRFRELCSAAASGRRGGILP